MGSPTLPPPPLAPSLSRADREATARLRGLYRARRWLAWLFVACCALLVGVPWLLSPGGARLLFPNLVIHWRPAGQVLLWMVVVALPTAPICLVGLVVYSLQIASERSRQER
jgi:formate hydrogenlyase subunit 3/multisubunit Na+/H+ antiporter MnhD subunit